MDHSTQYILLWDVDGTIVHPVSSHDLFHAVSMEFGGVAPTIKPKKAGKTDSRIAQEYLLEYGIKDIQINQFVDALNKLSDEFYSNHQMMQVEGITNALQQAFDIGWHNKLYTGNTSSRAIGKLKSANVPLEIINTEESYFLGEYPSRLEGVNSIITQGYAEIIVIGDTSYDYEIAKSLDCSFWFVGQGNQGVKQIGQSPNFIDIKSFQSVISGLYFK